MNRKFIFSLGGAIILSLLGLIVGFMIGVNVGGNYFTSFEFLGGRGYEASGYLGAIVGALVGLVIGALIGSRSSNIFFKNND